MKKECNGWRYGYVSPTTSLSNYNKTLQSLLTIPLVSGCKFKTMEYTEKEIKHIKALNWDKGWRMGWLASSILWIAVMIAVRFIPL